MKGMKWKNFRTKPVVIKAFKFTEEIEMIDYSSNNHSIRYVIINGQKCYCNCKFINGEAIPFELNIHTPDGVRVAQLGDWIICGVNGEIYPCKPDIFAKTYEVEHTPETIEDIWNI